mmetsp:Transcript_12247/g.28630  ORF Transcript_12247/g.28630 Transcript_12247/m.28630 type:complete len:302 (+) Transcript_12247:143-1048(+)
MLRILVLSALSACAVASPLGHATTMRGGSTKPRRMPTDNAPLTGADIGRVIYQVHANYPGALREDEFVAQLHAELASHSDEFGSMTLVATSLCCDEINRGLETKLAQKFGGNSFSMGGLAGFPFGGVTSFGAFAHHIPNPGSALVVYGPHVGVDANGAVGKIDRRGLANSGACCGSAAAALANARAVLAEGGTPPAPLPADFIDAQQSWVAHALLENGAAGVVGAPNPDAQLPRALFSAQRKAMEKIITAAAPGNVPDGNIIAVVGGIQINTPDGVSDYFLPIVFELRTCDGALVKDLMVR